MTTGPAPDDRLLLNIFGQFLLSGNQRFSDVLHVLFCFFWCYILWIDCLSISFPSQMPILQVMPLSSYTHLSSPTILGDLWDFEVYGWGSNKSSNTLCKTRRKSTKSHKKSLKMHTLHLWGQRRRLRRVAIGVQRCQRVAHFSFLDHFHGNYRNPT